MRIYERVIRGFGVFMLMLFVLVAVTPVTRVMSNQLAVPEAVHSSDAIVVLGAGLIHAGQLREESLRRIVRGIHGVGNPERSLIAGHVSQLNHLPNRLPLEGV